MLKSLGNLLVGILVVGFLFYLVVYIIMGFPHPQWSKDLHQQINQEISQPIN